MNNIFLARWTPWCQPGKLSDKLTSETAQKAHDLYAEALRRADYAEKTKLGHSDALAAYDATLAELEREVAAEVQECGDGTAAEKAAQQKAAAAAAADPQLWQPKIHAASEAARLALGDYISFLASYGTGEVAVALVDELRPDAVRVAEEYAKERAAFDKKVAPIVAEWSDIRSTVTGLLGIVEPFVDSDLPSGDDYAVPPLPTDDALARYHAHRNPS